MNEPQEPKAQQEQKKKPLVPPAPSARLPWLSELLYSKRAWLVVGALVLLLGIGGLVPVGKIPFLRNLAYAMGYTPDEASKMSFLKALFSWNDHSNMVRGERPDPDEVSVFGQGGGFFASKSERAQNKLFNLRSVNAGLAKQGRRGETVAGSSNRPEGEDRRASNIRVANPDASANTQANRAKTGEVYFGTDAAEIARDKNDGFNSVNSLKKIKNPHIARGSGNSNAWMDRLVDKAVQTDTNLETIAKGINKNASTLAQLGNMSSIGNSRAKRDMYYAWLTGRAARRTPQVVLKKTLATAGFNGAEMPRTVFTSTGFSGVGINPDDVVADVDSVQKYLEQDKNCQAAIEQGAQSMPSYDNIYGIRNQIISSFNAATCGSGLASYRGKLTTMSTTCVEMQRHYRDIQQGCGALSIVLDEEQCREVEILVGYATAFAEYCDNELSNCNNPEDPDAQAACEDEVRARGTNRTYSGNDGISYTGSELPGRVDGTYFNDNGGLKTDYFPGVDWQHSLWVDENAGN